MTTEDAVRIVEEAGPEVAVVTHFGMGMVFAGLGCEVERIGRESGVWTVAARGWDAC